PGRRMCHALALPCWIVYGLWAKGGGAPAATGGDAHPGAAARAGAGRAFGRLCGRFRGAGRGRTDGDRGAGADRGLPGGVPDGLRIAVSKLGAAPGAPVAMSGALRRDGDFELEGWLDQRLLGMEPGYGRSGPRSADSAAAPLIFIDAEEAATVLNTIASGFN